MFRNYLKTAWRNLRKNKTLSVINIFGLSVGIASFLLIVNYLLFEYGYDDGQKKKDRIFRIPMVISKKGEKEQTFAYTYPAAAPALKNEFPEIEEAVRFFPRGGIVTSGNKLIAEDKSVYYVDTSFFHIFTFRFVKGNASSALRELNDAVITAETAKKYFGDADPIGKTLRYWNEDYIITTVIENPPPNSHMRFNILLNYNKIIQWTHGYFNTSWDFPYMNFYTYVLLKPGTNANLLQAKLPAFAERHLGSTMTQNGSLISLSLQRLKDIHLRSRYDYEMEGNGNLNYLKYLGIAALFVLIIAWMNYINLSTAQSLDRSTEVGVRKVVGAGRFQLIRQFLTESLLLNVVAFLLGVIIFKLTLTSFSNLIQKEVNSFNISDWRFGIFGITFLLLGTLLSAFYPAFVMSSFNPIYSIKGSQSHSETKGGKTILRKSLVVIQFMAAIVLIAGAIGFKRQLQFMRNRDLGINIQQTLVLQKIPTYDSSDFHGITAFRNDLGSNPSIVSVTASSDVPGSEGMSTKFALKGSTEEKPCRSLGIDNNFIPSYGLKIIAGRNFSNDRFAYDTSFVQSIIVNESAAKFFGFNKPSQILGQELTAAGFIRCQVVGVVKDFHQRSLQYNFDPIIFSPMQEAGWANLSLKLNTTNLSGVMDFVKSKWSAYFPESPLRFFFLDERFHDQYKNDQLFSTVLWLFTFIAIIVACLGLFGLSLFTIKKRSKEISIRKVFGATVLQITGLIARDYLRLVVIAGFIALPLAFVLLNNWLKKYAFRIDIGLWFFFLPVILILSIALITVLYQSAKAALANPVKNLKNE